MGSSEGSKTLITSAWALVSVLLAVLAAAVLHGGLATACIVVGVLINVPCVWYYPRIPSRGSIPKFVFLFMGVPAVAAAAVFGFVAFGWHGWIYLLFAFVVFVFAFATRR